MASEEPFQRVIEIRTYRLRARKTRSFDEAVAEAVPLLRDAGIDFVRASPSERNEDGVEEYVMIRSFGSLDEREELERRFYSSPAWQQGLRDTVLSLIEGYHTIVVTVPVSVIEGLRQG